MEKQTEMNEHPTNQNENEGDISPKETTPQEHAKNHRKSSSLRAANQWRSAVGHARAHSHNDVEGHNKIANTGPYIDYDDV